MAVTPFRLPRPHPPTPIQPASIATTPLPVYPGLMLSFISSCDCDPLNYTINQKHQAGAEKHKQYLRIE